MKELTYSDIPHNWAICFDATCPLASQCLRHHAAKLAPDTLLEHNTVLPVARFVAQDSPADAQQQTETESVCRAYVADAPVTLAYGMRNLFDEVHPYEVRALRQLVQMVFGQQSHYYRYREGRYPITPKQQARVEDIFLRHGYTKAPKFDRYEVQYHFPSMGK